MRGRLVGVEWRVRSSECNDALATDAGGVALTFGELGEQRGGDFEIEAPAASVRAGGGRFAVVGPVTEWAGGHRCGKFDRSLGF